jgi:ferrous iron transport protein B
LSAHGPQRFSEINKTLEQLEVSGQNPEKAKELRSLRLENSYVGILGKQIEPVIKPLGFDWKIGISLITSFAAREVFVGTMATIYGSDQEESGIRQKLVNEKNSAGLPVYTTAVCVALLLFYAFALQCMSTIATVKRETKSWKWPLAQLVFMTSLAYLSALVAYNVLS